MTHICVSILTITGSYNGLSPGRRQAIIWTNAGILLIGPLGTNFSENFIEILTFLFTKMRLKVSSAKWRPFCLGLNALMCRNDTMYECIILFLRKISARKGPICFMLKSYRKIYNIRRTKSRNLMILVSSCICLCPIYWSQVLSWEWRCSWSSADRRCSNYIWVINNLITYWGAAYIRDLTVYHCGDAMHACIVVLTGCRCLWKGTSSTNSF